MLRLTVIGHARIADDIIGQLQRAGVVEIQRRPIEHERVEDMRVDQARVHRLEELLAEAQFVRDFLHRYHVPDVAFGTFISEKIHLSETEYLELGPDDEFMSVYRECDRLSARLADIDRETARLENLVTDLTPWQELSLPISEWRGTEHVHLSTGVVPLAGSVDIRQALREAVSDVTIAEVGNIGTTEAWVVMAHVSVADEVRAALALTDFAEIGFPGLSDSPAEEIARARTKLEDLDKERVGLEVRIREIVTYYPRAVALVRSLETDKDALLIRSSFCATNLAFVISGWVPEHRRVELVGLIESLDPEIDLTFEKPEIGDDVPVELLNSRFVRPFEVLTDLYGRPGYFAFDPTPLLAPFFFLFFGMCLGDVGYGLMLMGGCWLIKTRLDIGVGVKRFMDLLILGGFASVLWGALTRSYLALQVDRLPGFLQYEPLLDPQADLLLLLGVTVAIGVVHVSIGVALGAYQAWHRGDVIESVSEHLSVLAFFVCLIVALLGFVNVIDQAISGPVLIGGFVGLMLLKGRLLDVVFGRAPLSHLALVPLKGFLGMYGMVGYGSDFLSYTRLAALGLASLYVGDAMNRLTQLSGGIPWFGWLFAALIFVVGHVFNVVINVLGAFVHPTRLMYVEFFGKFYDGGGRAFAPFSLRAKQLVIHPQTAGEQEGGSAPWRRAS